MKGKLFGFQIKETAFSMTSQFMSGECTGVHAPSHLNKYLAQGDEGCAELCQKQAADEEIPLVLSEELWNQTNGVEHTQSEKTNTGMEKNK